jgi:dihydropyrimidinase
VTITNSMLHHNVDYTPYEGTKVKGWPVTTLSRGEIVWDNGRVTGKPGRGRFLKCELPDPARPKPAR